MHSTLYYLHALSALHLGTGQGAGFIDLPIAREKATHLPYVPGSSLKGVLREELKPDDGQAKDTWEALFGPETIDDTNGYAGALAIGDARLLCLPVRSLAGTFAWATCPFVLARYRRETEAVEANVNGPTPPHLPNDHTAWLTGNSALGMNGTIVLEDLDLEVAAGAAETWAEHFAQVIFPGDDSWQALFKARFAILPDGVFDFLAETAMEIRARVRLTEQRTVAKGALWYEENLPAETLLYGLVAADRSRKNGLDLSAEKALNTLPAGPLRLQLGGKATVGRGLVRWIKKGV
ncbi:type III-B CRISPR module RAMP protein Cmr4 [Candidatus Methylocalor cossyra]|uniref:Type III-B CRISPR module RAMP protein Cmr4 n=1 Tax=Candidatus Methylocalor cossyra TaxID=3108543 RepID=A0ABP1C9W1_9GAMM